jgi:hypothetical protein
MGLPLPRAWLLSLVATSAALLCQGFVAAMYAAIARCASALRPLAADVRHWHHAYLFLHSPTAARGMRKVALSFSGRFPFTPPVDDRTGRALRPAYVESFLQLALLSMQGIFYSLIGLWVSLTIDSSMWCPCGWLS